jgi:hypothetical protein
MNCLECRLEGRQEPAIGICQSCGAGICRRPAIVVEQRIETTVPVCKTVVLPRSARSLLCATCRAAIKQPRLARTA